MKKPYLLVGLLGALPCFLACTPDSGTSAQEIQALRVSNPGSPATLASPSSPASPEKIADLTDDGGGGRSNLSQRRSMSGRTQLGRTRTQAGADSLADADGGNTSHPLGAVNDLGTRELREFKLGDPITGLTPEELAAFERGRAVFEHRWKPSEGLGPFYNAVACASCHSTPTTGGSAPLYRNFYLAVYGTSSVQGPAIPPFLSTVVPSYGSGDFHATASEFTLEGGRPLIPPTIEVDGFTFPVISAQRNSIPVFGTGLFEFVSDVTIMSNADPLDSDGDGIRGRWNTENGAIGRFGSKAQVNNIELFTRGPLQAQMGITSDPFLGDSGTISMAASAMQISANPNMPTTDNDSVQDPEISHQDLGDLIAFTRFLAPPRPKPLNDAAARGLTRFHVIGCAKCHVPSLESSRGPVKAYTNLLIHYMGTQLADDVRFDDGVFNTARFFRTAPLWGVSNNAPYLHDGRAETLEEAILAHGGESLGPRNSFFLLSAKERQDLIAFLEHL